MAEPLSDVCKFPWISSSKILFKEKVAQSSQDKTLKNKLRDFNKQYLESLKKQIIGLPL